MVAFTLRLEEEDYKLLKLAAFLEGRSQSVIIREALDAYLEKYEEVEDPRGE